MAKRATKPILMAILLSACAAGAKGTTSAPADAAPADAPLRVVMFYSPTCGSCPKALAALDASEKRWGERIEVVRWHMEEDKAAYNELFAYDEHYGSEKADLPKVFVGGRWLGGATAIVKNLDEAIAAELTSGARTFVPREPMADDGGKANANPADDEDAETAKLVERFESLGVIAVVAGGLVDGVNPCAFATIVFLISMLTYLGKSRREVAMVGAGFTTAVFVAYFLLGCTMLRAVQAFSVSHGIAAAISYGVAGLAFVLAGWSLVDFVRYTRTGDAKKVTLVLPKAVKSGIHKVIRKGLSGPWLLGGAIAVGVLVALLESLCTGQVYLPIVLVIQRVPELRASAMRYLLLYNLMFIAPLVAILIIACLGVGSQQLAAFLTRRLGLLKLALAILFAGLGTLVLATV